eukprot:m.399376 g.399376  ORF g.399376 m.399376 type:complete len:109 (+) comp21147_c0_seq2:296-622(+)
MGPPSKANIRLKEDTLHKHLKDTLLKDNPITRKPLVHINSKDNISNPCNTSNSPLQSSLDSLSCTHKQSMCMRMTMSVNEQSSGGASKRIPMQHCVEPLAPVCFAGVA